MAVGFGGVGAGERGLGFSLRMRVLRCGRFAGVVRSGGSGEGLVEGVGAAASGAVG